MMSFIHAIARQEGWSVIGARCRRNNNPGNIRFGSFAYRLGAREQDDAGFAIFPSEAQGWQALRELLEANYKGLTIAQAIGRYAPSGENNTQAYIAHVCAWTGLSPDHVLVDLDFN
ncbi:MAG TPA: hypothetical protein VKX41_15185 [Alloacidobacterium sp.]|nr:hypothetical protein [Alloacidobacterium sp.]